MRGFEALDKMLRSRGFFSGKAVEKQICSFSAASSKKRGLRKNSKTKATPRRKTSFNSRGSAAISPGAGTSVEACPVHPESLSSDLGRCSGLRTPLASNANPVCWSDIGRHVLAISDWQLIQHS